MKKILIAGIVLFLSQVFYGLGVADYGVSEEIWPEHLGSQRAVVSVSASDSNVEVSIPWRMKFYPSNGDVIVIEAATGQEITQVAKKSADRISGSIQFRSRAEGIYYVYYLPYIPDTTHGHFKGRYTRFFGKKSLSGQVLSDSAALVKIESRTVFDSFYPMEVIATVDEVFLLKKNNSGKPFMIFCEDREFPVKTKKDLPLRWIESGEKTSIDLKAKKNEYYSFQIAVVAGNSDIQNLRIEFADLVSASGQIISAERLTCFNTEGVDYTGKPFSKVVNVAAGSVQPMWIGIDIPEVVQAGLYSADFVVASDNGSRSVKVSLNIDDQVLADRGDSQPWKYSRLRWLNSTLGHEAVVVKPYSPLVLKNSDNQFEIVYNNREITLGNNGLPLQISANGVEILASPVDFLVDVTGSSASISEKLEIVKAADDRIDWKFVKETADYSLVLEAFTEFDGYVEWNYSILWKKNRLVKNFYLDIPFKSSIAKTMMGMNLSGRATPKCHIAKWIKPQDSFWIGSAQAGIHCELKGADYTGPMLNLYKPAPPASWFNNGLGWLGIKSKADQTRAYVRTGSKICKAGSTDKFSFSFIITPVKELDTESHFSYRYYHSGGNTVIPSQEIIDKGVNVVNVHHANKYNPYINYPFIAQEEFKELIKINQASGIKTKIYYTVRELSSITTEIWALRSLGDEIFPYGNGGGFPWLREHFEDDYVLQWYAPNIAPSVPDAAILTSVNSRWYNYYIEGLRWMFENYDIDGLYLDDVAFDRTMLKRIRRVMDAAKPGCLIDLHSNTNFSKGPAIQYTEFFPYINKLWFGESFKYNQMSPENWLVESSGIPFGLMGDMLQDGGNPWLGLVFGMTNRLPWGSEGTIGDPRVMWELFDRIGMAKAHMIPYWSPSAVVFTSHEDVKATAYLNRESGYLMVAIGNWSVISKKVKISIDLASLGIDPGKASIEVPVLQGFQDSIELSLDKIELTLEPKKGKVLLIKF
ncbi:MAG: hypothetical protein JXR63_01975 [Spirochaetales bacterium]|nr:hypothetical protein [Spirochaetales bacterium]